MSVSSDRLRVPSANFPDQLNAAQAGDGWAFDELFATWNAPVTGFVRARGVTDVNGVVNDTFLRAFSSIRSFDGDESGFRAWLFTIARNRIIDEARKNSRRPTTIHLDEASTVAGGDVVADAESRFGDDRVVALLGLLTDEQREVLTLRFVADLTIDQIAEATGRRRGAVKQLQRRALRRLERELESQQ